IPRRSDLIVGLNDVLVSPVERNGKCRPGTAGRSLETLVARYHAIRQDAAVAPASAAQPVRIRDSHLHNVIYTCLQLLSFVMSPVGENRPRVFLASSRAAAVVDSQHRVSISGEPLALNTE